MPPRGPLSIVGAPQYHAWITSGGEPTLGACIRVSAQSMAMSVLRCGAAVWDGWLWHACWASAEACDNTAARMPHKVDIRPPCGIPHVACARARWCTGATQASPAAWRGAPVVPSSGRGSLTDRGTCAGGRDRGAQQAGDCCDRYERAEQPQPRAGDAADHAHGRHQGGGDAAQPAGPSRVGAGGPQRGRRERAQGGAEHQQVPVCSRRRHRGAASGAAPHSVPEQQAHTGTTRLTTGWFEGVCYPCWRRMIWVGLQLAAMFSRCSVPAVDC